MRKFRIQGFFLQSQATALELSELRLWSDTDPVDDGVIVRSSHEPVAGTLRALVDDDLFSTCKFALAHVVQPNFYIEFELPDDRAVQQVKVASGSVVKNSCIWFDVYEIVNAKAERLFRYDGYGASAANQWYVYELPRASTGVPGAPVQTDIWNWVRSEVPVPTEGEIGDLLLFIARIRHEARDNTFLASIRDSSSWTLVAYTEKATSPQDPGTERLLVLMKRRSGDESNVVLSGDACYGSAVVIQVPLYGQGATVDVQTSNINDGISLGSTEIPLLEGRDSRSLFIHVLSSLWFANAGGGWRGTSGEALTADFIVGAQETPIQTRQDRLTVLARAGAMGGGVRLREFTGEATGGVSRVLLKITPVDARTHTTNSLAGRVIAGGVVLPQDAMVAAMVQTASIDMEFGGPGTIHGTVEQKLTGDTTLPLKRRVRLHRSRDGLLVRETWSDENGHYRFDGLSTRYEYDVIAWDHEGQFRSTIANNLKPEVLR